MNICIKYGFDILIIFGSYGGHKRHMTYDARCTVKHHRYGISSAQVSNKRKSENVFLVKVKQFQVNNKILVNVL